MDYKKRKYFLVSFDGYSYDYRIKVLKLCVSSIKFSSPYNHFKYQKGYDGDAMEQMHNPYYWQLMISCDIEDEEKLLYELKKANRRDTDGCRWFELTKELCCQ